MSLSYVSIDWGGTHLNGIVIKDKKTIQEFELPAGNLKILSEENLCKICKNILDSIELSEDSKIVMLIGAAGVSDKKTSDRLINIFRQLTDSIKGIEIYPDFLCNHAAFLNGEDGILSINGTGSILFGVKGNKQIRLGGWGYVFDETPSGSYFGKKYLESVLIGIEGDKTHQYYVDDYIANYGTPEREKILNRIYFASSIQNCLGEYSRNMIQAYEAKERYAVEIINDSVEKLSVSIKNMISLLGFQKPNFCGSGGLWTNWKDLKKLLSESCESKGIQLVWQEKQKPLSMGPILCYARNHDNREKGEQESRIAEEQKS